MFITLSTDFGLRDPYVAILKGHILQRFAAAQILDLTHAITPFRPEEAGYWLCQVLPQFPGGTVHVAVVDPGVGTARALLLMQAAGQLLLAPDNGLLEPLQRRYPQAVCRRIDLAVMEALGIRIRSATFHGRDVLAPLAAELAMGRVAAEAVGPPIGRIEPGRLPRPTQDGAGALCGSVVLIDHYGNLITDLQGESVQSLGEAVRVTVAGTTVALQRTYGAAAPGTGLALINSAGMLEIAVAQGNAARVLEVQWGAAVRAQA